MKLFTRFPAFRWILAALVSWLRAGSSSPASADEPAFARGGVAHEIGLGEARWTSGFWFERVETLRTNLLPAMVRLMEGTNVSQYLENFRLAAGLTDGRPRGAPFNDGDFYKMLEAASVVLAFAPDTALSNTVDHAIQVIGMAQRSDGYLHTPVLARARLGDTNAVPFRDRNHFELYNLGHLMTAACAHHRATGLTHFLAVAQRAAEFLGRLVDGGTPAAAHSSVCPSHFMGLVDLARTTGDPHYLAIARRFFALRSEVADGGDDNQDRLPFERQDHAMGHAVRANYLYAGAADLFLATGDRSYWSPLGSIWTNVVSRKMHVTGGCGALFDGASPDGSRDQRSITRVHQAYGRDYQLPSTTAHNETCAAIGNLLWNWRMFLATGDARHLDVLEIALHNGVLAGVALDQPHYFYTNPLRVTDPMPTELRWSRSRVPYVSSFCCPPNLLRTLARSATYAYATSPSTLWVTLYGAGTLRTRISGQPVVLTQETEFPWNGRVRLRIGTPGPVTLGVRLRIPAWVPRNSWAGELRLRVNGTEVPATPDSLGFAEVRRTWNEDDVLDLDLPMPVQRLEANPLVEETLNQVAIRRGPLVYCLESADLPPGTRITDVVVPDAIDLIARHDRRALGGCVFIEGRGAKRASVAWGSALYRPLPSPPSEPQSLNLRWVPYALWGNRGKGEMSVWLPRVSHWGPRRP